MQATHAVLNEDVVFEIVLSVLPQYYNINDSLHAFSKKYTGMHTQPQVHIHTDTRITCIYVIILKMGLQHTV